MRPRSCSRVVGDLWLGYMRPSWFHQMSRQHIEVNLNFRPCSIAAGDFSGFVSLLLVGYAEQRPDTCVIYGVMPPIAVAPAWRYAQPLRRHRPPSMPALPPGLFGNYRSALLPSPFSPRPSIRFLTSHLLISERVC